MSPAFIDFRVRSADQATRLEVADDEDNGYVRVYGAGFTDDRSLETLVADLEAANGLAVMQAEWEVEDPLEINQRVSAAIHAHPDRLVAGIATTDPRLPGALELLRHAHDDLGLRGWNVQPGFLQVEVMDPRCRPILDYCQENGHPVTVHTGVNFSPNGSIGYGRPLAICDLACAYPELVVVANHGGWPWVTELLAVLWKHPNVYADFGAIAPKRMVGPKGGWEPVAHWMNTMVSDQVLLATDWPMMRHSRLMEELELLGLGEESYRKYAYLNAARLIDRVWGLDLARG